METLNDDCQLLIVKYLDLPDQLNLFQATKESKKRWASNIRYSWRHQLGFYLYPCHFKHFDENPDLLHDPFLASISSSVQHLHLEDVTLFRLKTWTNYEFPKMTSLECRLRISYANNNSNNNKDNSQWEEANLIIQLISELFPRLKRICIHGGFNANFLSKLMHLRKLEMYPKYPDSKTYEIAKGIGELRSLEELTILDDNLRKEHAEMFMHLPKLEKLTISHMSNIGLRCIIERRAEDIEKITFNDGVLFKLIILKKCINLRHMTLVGPVSINDDELQQTIRALQMLERLDMMDTGIFLSVNDLWQIVECCPSLNIVSITKMYLNEHFFCSDRQHMETVLNKRFTPLTLHFHDLNGLVDERTIRLYFQHSRLKLSLEPWKIDEIDRDSVKFYFKPLATKTNEDEAKCRD